MSVDYRFTVKNKKDNSELASFWFNQIKNLSDIYTRDLNLVFDPEQISSRANEPSKLTITELDSDINILNSNIKLLDAQISEKKIMMLVAIKPEIVDVFKEDLHDLEEDRTNHLYAYISLLSLRSIITTICEDMIINDETRYISTNDIIIEAYASY